MFKTTAARALVGVAALGVLGGTTALAATRAVPSPRAGAVQQKPAPGANSAARDHVAGKVTAVTDASLSIDHQAGPRAAARGAQPSGSVTFVLDGDTRVYRAGDRKTDVGRGAIKVGDRVGVKFTEADGKKLAKVVVILPDGRAGRIESKDADGHTFTIKTRDGNTVKVITSDQTKFVEGRPKHRQAGSFADLQVGDRVVVVGEEGGQGTFNARVVHSARHDAAGSQG